MSSGLVSILSKPGGVRAALPVAFPAEGEWLVGGDGRRRDNLSLECTIVT